MPRTTAPRHGPQPRAIARRGTSEDTHLLKATRVLMTAVSESSSDVPEEVDTSSSDRPSSEPSPSEPSSSNPSDSGAPEPRSSTPSSPRSSTPSHAPDEASGRAESTEPGASTDESGASTEDAAIHASEVESLDKELKRLRRDIQRLQAELDATPSPSWRERHPVLTLFLVTGLGAAAGYLGSKLGRTETGDDARNHLLDLTSRARSALAPIPDSLDGASNSARSSGGHESSTLTDTLTDNAEPAKREPGWFGSSNGEASSTTGDVLDRMTRSARKARQSVQDRARTATQEATERMVESVASDDDVLPASVKAKAAGLAATTVGGMLAKRLLRSAGRIGASMLLAYLGKKILDTLRGR